MRIKLYKILLKSRAQHYRHHARRVRHCMHHIRLLYGPTSIRGAKQIAAIRLANSCSKTSDFCLVGIESFLLMLCAQQITSSNTQKEGLLSGSGQLSFCHARQFRFAKTRIHQMKNYTIKATGTSKVAAALASQLNKGKAGEILISAGFNQDTFAIFLANLASKALAAGYDAKKLAGLFRQVAAGNASQARQALADVVIEIEGEKPASLGAFWQGTDSKPAVDLSALEAL